MLNAKSSSIPDAVLPSVADLPILEIDRLPLAYIVFDVDLRIRVWNRAAERIFGFTNKEAVGQMANELIVPPPYREAVRQVLGLLRSGAMDAHSVNDNVTRDGRTITCEWFNTPVHNEAGEIAYIVSLTRDITARRQTELALEQYAARLQGLSRRLVEVQEIERRHLARELHDQFGQILTGLLTLLSANDIPMPEPAKVRCCAAQNLVRDLLERVRKLSFDLRPAALDQLGLVPALFTLFERYTEQTTVRVDFRHQGLDRRFPAEIETVAFRIVQEALTNVARHAQVNEVSVRVWATEDVLGVCIEDHGRGFDLNLGVDPSRSSGLTGMHERAKLLGSLLTIESRPGHGTVVIAELNLHQSNERAG